MSYFLSTYPSLIMAFLHPDCLCDIRFRPSSLMSIFIENETIGRCQPIEKSQVLHTIVFRNRSIKEPHTIDVYQFKMILFINQDICRIKITMQYACIMKRSHKLRIDHCQLFIEGHLFNQSWTDWLTICVLTDIINLRNKTKDCFLDICYLVWRFEAPLTQQYRILIRATCFTFTKECINDAFNDIIALETLHDQLFPLYLK